MTSLLRENNPAEGGVVGVCVRAGGTNTHKGSLRPFPLGATRAKDERRRTLAKRNLVAEATR